MGGFGSGRTGGRPKAEHIRSIDANRMNRNGVFRDRFWGSWPWTRNGREIAQIGVSSDGESVTLSYSYRRTGDSKWQDVRQRVKIERVPCRFGGTRAYFICPGAGNGRRCERRAVKLYGAGRYFLCRHCHRIAYTSQSETELDRLYRRSSKLRERLDGVPGIWNALPQKPKGMWQRTYQRRLAQVVEADLRAKYQWTANSVAYLDQINPGWRER